VREAKCGVPLLQAVRHGHRVAAAAAMSAVIPTGAKEPPAATFLSVCVQGTACVTSCPVPAVTGQVCAW